MGADIYDWERVHGPGSYEALIAAGDGDGGKNVTGYVLCGAPSLSPAGQGAYEDCDRRRGHLGDHSWYVPPPVIRPHDCLGERLTALEARIADLERRAGCGGGGGRC